MFERLQDRIVVFVAALLIIVELVSFFSIRYAIQVTSQNTMREELATGANVFKYLLDQNSQQLVEATSVLTYDYGFREAVATRDRETILSALTNHAARIKASGMGVIGLDGIVVADTLLADAAGKAFEFPELIEHATLAGRTSGIRVIKGKPYQVVVVPVLAPLPIAWVVMSFVIDDVAAQNLRRLTSADVSFVQRNSGTAVILATTLPRLRRQSLEAGLPGILTDTTAFTGATVKLPDDEYEILVQAVDGSGKIPMYAVLQRASAEGQLATLRIQAALYIIAGLSVATTLFGAMRIARQITRPVSKLSAAVREVERGNYEVRTGLTDRDEIGELAQAFDRMAAGLAERDRMRDVLGKVASTEVVTQLLDGRIELGGEEREVTVMFVDIRNFTGLAEELPPQQSLQMLNAFLTVVSQVIEAHGGVVDKYLGDGAMALFGAPVMRPDDAQRAVACALEIRKQILALGPMLAEKGLPHPQLGIGLNTSRVIAGNIGSPSRLNYTVLGDGVNLASRLEGLTRRYNVPIVIGEATRDLVPEVVCREIDKVRVRGRTTAGRIFEPLGRSDEVGAATLEQLARWHESLDMFRNRRWDDAQVRMSEFASVPEYARTVELYRGYIEQLREKPPGPDWDAAFTLYDK
ncbi:MAG TPA: adenylate/guanylate cyclase domain-containing protein [Usitatibacter sp.]